MRRYKLTRLKDAITRQLSAVLISTLIFSTSAMAAIQCYECHGSKSPIDYRPVDSSYRNISTGGFKGNHRTHLSESSSVRQCERCHTGSSLYNQGHSDRKIQLSYSLNNSSLRALYDNRTSAWPQTSTPTQGTCTNVNCHFEAITPQWGSSIFSYPNDCNQCHGAPPSGGSTGAAGSHARHDLYFTGSSNCIKCHPGHSGFGHATSAGRELVVTLRDSANILSGSYNGPVDDYLPSQANLFGTCANLYCHSDGTSLSSNVIQPNNTPEWGSTGPLSCTECHATPPSYPNGSPKPNSHSRHQSKGYDCNRCHYGTTADNTTISGTNKHVNKSYDISSGTDQLSYTYHSNGGTCSNAYCHSNGTSVSTGIVPAYTSAAWGSGTLNCSSCHGYPPAYVNKTPKANSHSKHKSYNYGCNTCHVTTTSDGTTISGQAVHVDGRYNVDPAPSVQFSFSSAVGGSNCFSISCHSDGTSIATGISSTRNAIWGKSQGCTICHNNRPSYPNGSPKANSHLYSAHKLNCSYCHYATTSNGTAITTIVNHLNGSYTVTPNNLISMNYSFATTGGTCTNTSCHATASGARRWGAQPDDCNGCHESPPNTPAHKKHFSGTSIQASYTSVSIAGSADTGYLFNCANCHPRDINRHRDGFVDVELYDPSSPETSVKFLNPAAAAYTPWSSVQYDSRNYPYTNGTCSNVYCHSYTSWATPVDCTFTNESGSRYCDNYATTNAVSTRIYKDVSWNSSLPKDCSGCHANAPRTDYTTNDGMTGDSHSWGNPGRYEQGHFNKEWFDMNPITCNYCHNDTVKAESRWSRTDNPYYTNFSSVPVADYSKHVNGKKDVAFEKSKPFTMKWADWISGEQTKDFDLGNASYAPETRTCSNVSCHKGQTSVKWGKTYRGYKAWNGIDYVCWECHTQGY